MTGVQTCALPICSISDLEPITNTFKAGLAADVGETLPLDHYTRLVAEVDGLREAVAQVAPDATGPATQAAAVEFILEGLHLNKRLNKDAVSGQARYRG